MKSHRVNAKRSQLLLPAILVAAILTSLFVAGCTGDTDKSVNEGLPDGLYAKIETTRGEILALLDFEKAPMTVANFVGLSEGSIPFKNKDSKFFYDGLSFHRVIKDRMILSGCPAGNGTGGPGYVLPDEINPSLTHSSPGILSMASAGPNTNGSQFLVTLVALPELDGKNTVFGHVISGMDVLASIAEGDILKKITIIRRGPKAQNYIINPDMLNNLVRATVQKSRGQQSTDIVLDIAKRWPDLATTQSGLRYKILREGRGTEKPRMGTPVTVHYKGMLMDNTVFDSSYDRGEPATFSVGQLIKGWNEALMDMRRNEKRLLVIPPELGYGSAGAGKEIPPNAWLVFEVELVSF
ncbi:MAG: peptidylprolyl isomerase [Spirochaetaceae bacterium]|nr:MAG: peptidylprolyl isomerase [Spirochaetaceae bacterium]